MIAVTLVIKTHTVNPKAFADLLRGIADHVEKNPNAQGGVDSGKFVACDTDTKQESEFSVVVNFKAK